MLIFVGQGRADLGEDALWGSIAILGSAICYAVNIVVMRRQAQNARPLEIAFFQFLVGGAGFWLATLIVGVPAYPHGQEGGLLLATLLAIAGMLLLAWAYARAGAAYLSATEYSGFLYAASAWLDRIRGGALAIHRRRRNADHRRLPHGGATPRQDRTSDA